MMNIHKSSSIIVDGSHLLAKTGCRSQRTGVLFPSSADNSAEMYYPDPVIDFCLFVPPHKTENHYAPYGLRSLVNILTTFSTEISSEYVKAIDVFRSLLGDTGYDADPQKRFPIHSVSTQKTTADTQIPSGAIMRKHVEPNKLQQKTLTFPPQAVCPFPIHDRHSLFS